MLRRFTLRTIVASALTVLVVGVLLLGLSGYLDPLQGAILRPISRLQSWLAVRVAATRDLISSPRDIAAMQEEIRRLEREVARLEQEIVSLREQASEAEVLAALLNYARSQPESRYLATNVIGRDVSPFLRSIWIGRGSEAGISRGMPIVTERGLVGRVVEVFPTVARVQLITDPEAAVNLRFQTSRAEGVLSAQLNGELWVDLIDQNAEIQQDELVLTSGLGGKYPPDIPVGRVISIRSRDFELFQQAVIQSTVDFNDLDIVLVITNFRPLPVGEGGP
jgi:rod shape-determining protein MreC